ncbi:MAG: hypothetical protein KA250_09895 [Verrucomicrobiales bacterium]|jgi:hypothetical protein|nr:hypothetical protein [Verrucomicrobiales bacterium]
MARRPRADEERSMDSLMDALTNVVGILLLILIISSLGISAAVKQVVENLPEVTKEELEAMKVSRDKTLKNLQELQQTHSNTTANLPTPEEATDLVTELEDFEKNNQDLADKTSDIAEWKSKVDQEEVSKVENDGKVKTADEKNRELAALLAQTPEAVVAQAKEVLMPNPRLADAESRALYLVCKFGKLYYIGDPYEHAFKIRDVIDQNFADLAYTGKAIGSYTYPIKGTKKNDAGAFLSITEKYRLSRREKEALASWDSLTLSWTSREGVLSKDISVLQRIFGSNEEAELPVSKFRYDFKKIAAFFGDGKLGPKDFKYYIAQSSGDKIKMALEMKTDGGWTPDEFLAANSQFEQYCKQASSNRRTLFYFHVAPDSFETYLQARAKSEQFRVPAGWSVWDGEKLEPRASPVMDVVRYNLDILPDAEYMKLANTAGPYMVEERNKEHTEFAARVEASVPATVTEPAAKADFVTKLSVERHDWNATRFQGYVLSIFQTALAATEASGQSDIVLEEHPPEIPQIRIFLPSSPPKAPTPPADPNKPAPKPAAPSGPGKLILD